METPLPITADEIPPEETTALLDKLAQGIVRRRLTTPAILVLETCKPLNFVGSQVMIALNPFVSAFFDAADYRKVALILEKDANLERLLVRIEELDVTASKVPSRNAQASPDGPHARTPRRGIAHSVSTFLSRIFRRGS